MRIVLDTNVIVSALINPQGNPGRAVDAFLAQTVTLLYDDRIVGEYAQVLMRPEFSFSPASVEALLEAVATIGELVNPEPLSVVLPDASDLPFIEVAVAGEADLLVSGNVRHFRPLRGRHDVDVVTPAEFVMRLRP